LTEQQQQHLPPQPVLDNSNNTYDDHYQW